jgi:uncharacterized protein with PIN domain
MSRTVVAAAFAASLIAVTGPALAADAHSRGAEPPAHKITLDHGRKWATDAPLREGMAQIRKALARHHAAVKKGTMSDAGYAELGAAIEKNVASILANCKLSPEADANLHVIIAQLTGAADELQAGPAASHEEAARKAMNAVNLYGRYFDHPGWKPLA